MKEILNRTVAILCLVAFLAVMAVVVFAGNSKEILAGFEGGLASAVNAIETGVEIIFFTALGLGVVYGGVKIWQATRVQVIRDGKDGRVARAIVHSGQVHQMYSAMFDALEQGKVQNQQLEYFDRLFGMTQKMLKAGKMVDEEEEIYEDEEEEEDFIPQAPAYPEVDPYITSKNLVLCYTVDGPQFGTVVDLLSMCVVGKPGRGKSTALLYYILILLKAGAEVWIWDPHSGLNELSYGLNYRDDLQDIETSCCELHHKLDERRQLWREQKRIMSPLLLLVDEMPVIADYEGFRTKEIRKEGKEELAEYEQWYKPSRLLKRFVLEARKWNCFVIVSGQAVPAEVLSTLTRDNLSSRIVFESCNMHARMAGLQKEEIDHLLPMLKGAGPGVAVMDVSRWSKPVLAAIPNTTVDDLRAFIDRGKSGEPFNQEETPFHPPVWVSGRTPDFPETTEETLPFMESVESAVKEAEKIVESVPHFSEEDERQIKEIARVHLATFNKVIRSKIPAAMDPPRNNAIYPAVKYICDREGW